MVIEVGRRFGLQGQPAVAARLADGCGNDQAIVAQELQKLALYIGASPQSAEGARSRGGRRGRRRCCPRATSCGSPTSRWPASSAELAEELARLPPGGTEAIPVVRALQRRLLMLAPTRARVERGERPDAVMTSLGRSLFWKDKPLVEQLLSRVGFARAWRRSRSAPASSSGR